MPRQLQALFVRANFILDLLARVTILRLESFAVARCSCPGFDWTSLGSNVRGYGFCGRRPIESASLIWNPETKCLRKTFELGEIPLARLVGSSAFGSPAMMSAKMRSAFPSSLKKPDLFSDETRFRCARRAKDDHQAAVPQRRANSRSQIRVCPAVLLRPEIPDKATRELARHGDLVCRQGPTELRRFPRLDAATKPIRGQVPCCRHACTNENYVLAAPFGRSRGWLLTPRNHIQ
jgi:hypothetical protein